jgi:acetyl esterase/lipase
MKERIEPQHMALNLNSLTLIGFLLLTGCTNQEIQAEQNISLTEARRGFKTVLISQKETNEPIEQAPAQIFKTIKYPAPSGQLSAYLSAEPSDNKKRPAIIWITGGDCNSIGDSWSPMPRDNDQTVAAYRKAGIVMMYPSLRGGNDNPGVKEGFLGEVDDVLAAANYLEKQASVDPTRIYLGGHSTGGTLALLVAESSARFRAVFSFGPVSNVSSYGRDSGFLPFDISNRQEVKLRSPGYWLASVQSPVWVLEGDTGSSNIDSLRAMAKVSDNPNARFIEVQGADHFSTLAPTNEIIAEKILQDSGTASNLSLSSEEVNAALVR